MRRFAVLLLALAACKPAAPAIETSATPVTSTTPDIAHILDSLALRARMDAWWPATLTADTAFFESVLAPEFVMGNGKIFMPSFDRAGFLSSTLQSPACGPTLTYQVLVASYTMLGDYAIAMQTVRVSDGDPVAWQNEFQYTVVFAKRGGKWMALRSWHYGRDLEAGDRVGRDGWARSMGDTSSRGPAEPWKQVKGPCPKYLPTPVPVVPPPVPPGKPTIRVRAIDVNTGRPLVIRTALVEFPARDGGAVMYQHQARADSTGLMQLDTASTRQFSLYCGGTKIFGRFLVALDSTQVKRAIAGDTIVLRVDASECNQRKIDTVRATFTGHYTAGFESSDLKLCGDSTKKIWITFWTKMTVPKGFQWPKGNDRYNPVYFVQLHGTMVGPDSYGHMGVSDYLLFVDTLVFARVPVKGDCGEGKR